MESPVLDDHPLFPLATVLVPGAVTVLQVFEPRYLVLLERVGVGRRPSGEVRVPDPGPLGHFGTVLIERGPEVGGGDTRRPVGVAVEIRRGRALADRWLLEIVATRRIRVDTWWSDAPHPRGRVEVLDDPDEADDHRRLVESTARLASSVRDLALAAGPGTLGDARPLAHVLGDRPPLERTDPGAQGALSWWIAAVSPLGPHDRQVLLETRGRHARVLRARDLLEDAAAVLRSLSDGPAER